MIYAISDLHLSFLVNKPMDMFGVNWKNHYKKIKEDWNLKVKSDDLVLIPGDVSWAMDLEDASLDFDFISKLPGEKIFVKGNHDYWWNSLSKLNNKYSNSNFIFLQNTSVLYNNISICGTRGWLCPNDINYTKEDEKIYNRELIRLESSLKKKDIRSEEIIVMMHYPPMNENKEESGFVKLFYKYNVNTVIYGHLHGKDSFINAPIGNINGINYKLVSADYLDFKLDLIC